jgi:hypothetical protein
MSKMYGKRRVVLSAKPTYLGNRLVCICGSDEASANRPGSKAGTYAPLGYWYEEGGLFWVDLKSRDQWYDSVNKETIANKRLGGVATKAALREYVMEYWLNQDAK